MCRWIFQICPKPFPVLFVLSPRPIVEEFGSAMYGLVTIVKYTITFAVLVERTLMNQSTENVSKAFFRFEIFAMAAAAPSTTNRPTRKLALVIGIGNYEGDKKLENPENDANDMSSMLTIIGFTVTAATNLTHAEMDFHVARFKHEIQAGDLVLFYFAGHGAQWEVCSENFSILNHFHIVMRFSSCNTARMRITWYQWGVSTWLVQI